MLFKSRGTLGVEKMIDNAFDNAKYFKDAITIRDGFRLVIPKFQYTNVCFWYIPKKLRNLPETDDWWNEIYQLTKAIKEAMQVTGKLVLSYNSLAQRNVGNFLRLPVKCCPPMNRATLDYIIEQIEWFGENV
jgi:glutamate/tyrosine decarboxylase-like PLP-dependent enzyme